MIPMPHRSNITKIALFIALCLLPLGLLVNSQILPDAPIEGVRVTMFSEEGFRLWNLKGGSATYGDNGIVEMTDMDLQIYQGEQGKDIDMHIVGAEAVYQSADRAVSGEGGVFVDGEFYEIEGENWNYSQDDRVVQVEKNVKVVIEYQLEAFLK
jgi:hypothetical protein